MNWFRSLLHSSDGSYSARALLRAVVDEAAGRGTYHNSEESPHEFIDRVIDQKARTLKNRPRNVHLKKFLDIDDAAGPQVCGLLFLSSENDETEKGGDDSLFLAQACPDCGANRPALQLSFTESLWEEAPSLVKEEVDRLTKGRSILGGKLQYAWCCYANAVQNRVAILNFLEGRAAGESHFWGPCPSCGDS